MSDRTKGMVWEMDLPHAEKWVLLAMADHADHDGGNIYPGMQLIAWKTDYSERHVKRIVASLMRKGILQLSDPTKRASRNNPFHINWQACTFRERPRRPRHGGPGRDTSGRMSPHAQPGSSVVVSPDGEGGDVGVTLMTLHDAGRRDILAPAEGTIVENEGTFGGKRRDIPTRADTHLTVLKNLKNRPYRTDRAVPAREREQECDEGEGEGEGSRGERFDGVEIGSDVPISCSRGISDGRTAYRDMDSLPDPDNDGEAFYIAEVARDYSVEFGDMEHVIENRHQALRLWRGCGLCAQDFVALMRRARSATWRQYQVSPHGRPLRKKMAYFFRVLRGLIESEAGMGAGAGAGPGEATGPP